MAELLLPGDPAPYFHAAALDGNPRFAFDTAAGRPLVLLFLGSGSWAGGADALRVLAAHRDLFDDQRAAFFGVSMDKGDAAAGRIAQSLPGVRWFLDYDAAVSTAYGAAVQARGRTSYRPHWLLLDPMLRVVSRRPLNEGEALMAEARAFVQAGWDMPAAPVLVVPRVFEPDLCRRLIDLYQAHGGEESGFMREENGVTVLKTDPNHKRRSDCIIEDAALLSQLRARLVRFLKPQIQRAFQFEVTRVERWLVACYDAEQGGHFRAHRDNTTKGTAHRRFACTLNLNAEDYDGGELRFPEFGPRTYRAPTGGAVIFSCSLLHEATPVTRGKRYAFLPFLYDEEGARVRQANLGFLSPELVQPEAEQPAAAAASN